MVRLCLGLGLEKSERQVFWGLATAVCGLSESVCRFSQSLSQPQLLFSFFVVVPVIAKIGKFILKFTWKCKGLTVAKPILKKKNSVGVCVC